MASPECVGILSFDPLTRVAVQQSIQYVRCLADGGRNGLICKGRKLIGNMGIGFQARFVSIFCIDQSRRLYEWQRNVGSFHLQKT